MTPQLERAIAAIQPLSSAERQQLLQLLNQEQPYTAVPTTLQTLNRQFWQGATLTELRQQQQPKTVEHLNDLAAHFWPIEESVDDFLVFLQEQRRAIS
ncbi:MAG: hypothetical protein AAGG51_21815 [Cyanobacteria bacterium P01_G01_bin.54]